ncbi:hypothetical protein, partial [Alistipes putredinis]|uniref:hypothetical protein n=1 Tax=Alistipes putredinis TaxID=28117 RepID=UPI003AAB2748
RKNSLKIHHTSRFQTLFCEKQHFSQNHPIRDPGISETSAGKSLRWYKPAIFRISCLQSGNYFISLRAV